MEDSRKKPLMIGIIIACVVLAVVVTIATRSSSSGGIDDIPEGVVWVKCDNPKCNAEYQLDQIEYYKFAEQNTKPSDLYPPPMNCKECGEQSVYIAIKCPKCGELFYSGDAGKKLKDTCPKCNFSEIEDRYKKAAEKAAENLPGV